MSSTITLSKTVFLFCLAFIAGIFFAPISILLGLFVVGSFYLFFRNFLLSVFAVLFFVIGAFYFQFTIYSIPEVVETPVQGKVSEEPFIRGNLKRLTFKHEKGTAFLYVGRYEDYKYGDILEVDGNFRKPSSEYKSYFKKDGVYHTSFYPQIEKIGEDSLLWRKATISLRDKMKSNLRRSVPSPQVSLLEAMVLGDRSSFTPDIRDRLSISGTYHITAISGMHIVIISAILFYIFSFLGISRRWSALFSLLGIIFFIFFVGAPVSAIRAGIMAGLLLLSYAFYRRARSFRTICFAATAMLALNPLLLSYDLGFQLSFLAVLGIIYFQPKIKEIIEEKNAFLKEKETLCNLLSVTLAAQMFVFPLILYNFGHIPVFSVFANILIVPLLPFIMIFGIFTAITGLLVFSFPVYLLLSFVLFVISLISSLPFAALTFHGISVYFPFLLYFPMLYLISKNFVVK